MSQIAVQIRSPQRMRKAWRLQFVEHSRNSEIRLMIYFEMELSKEYSVIDHHAIYATKKNINKLADKENELNCVKYYLICSCTVFRNAYGF